MTTSAKRYGLDVKGDLELEARLRRIEGELEKLLRSSDLGGDASSTTQRISDVPQVTGLRVLGKTPGAITLAWNQVRISDLRRYELDIAEDLAFTSNKQTYNVAGTEYQFSTVSSTGGGGATTIYARVRARSRSSGPGAYSVTLNTITGQAQSADIAPGAITAEKIDSSDPIEFTGLDDADVGAKLSLSGYINGLTLSNNSIDANRDIDIASGVARDSTGVLSIILSSSLTKQIDAVWASGTNAGGRASGVSLSADTWYYVFLVSNSTGAAVDAGFDTSISAANLLSDSNLTLYRRIGAVRTDSSSNIYAFTQLNNEFIWDVPKQDVALSNPGTAEVTHTLDYVPTGYKVFANVSITFFNSINIGDNARAYAYGGGNTTLSAPGSGFNDIRIYGDQRGGSVHDKVLTSTSAQIKTRQEITGATFVVFIQVHGWVDPRGKDGTT